ncbi:MAG: GIY-YIG nuclease family protein [Actinomycetota bacterium]
MCYVYVLLDRNNKFYTGYTGNLKQRMEQHNNGGVRSTKNNRPLQLIYYEACIDNKDALKREKYLKSTWGKRYLTNRLKNYLTG